MSAACLRRIALCTLLASAAASSVRAQDAAALFQRGFYLQVHERDLAAAAAAFEKAAADTQAPDTLRTEARTRLAQCREDLATADLAHLMPADALAYVELNRPGDQLARLAKMLGLVRETPPTGPPADGAGGIPLGDGLFFPADFSISPALVAELRKIRGAAAALTAINQRGMPDGVLVVHPGDCDLLRGVLETAVQFVEPAEAIGGFRAYRFRDGNQEVWLTMTARLLIASPQRAGVVAAVERLQNPQADSLAKREQFRALADERRDGLLFAYVDGQAAAAQLKTQLAGQEAAIVRAVLDLEHLESFTFVAGVNDESVQLVARLNLMPGHHNLAYNLIRTAPFTRRSLAQVPRGAAAVALVGLNPPTAGGAAQPSASDAPPEVTGMDLGREIFANVEEVALFVLPPSGERTGRRSPLPEMAAVFAVKDAAKSEAIWNQILGLAALFGVRDPEPKDVTIEGQLGKEYRVPEMPPVIVLRGAERTLLVGTAGAVNAAVRGAAAHQTILEDESYAKLLAGLPPHGSKAVLVDAGRMVQTVRDVSGGGNNAEMLMAGIVLKDLRLSLVTDEAPNCLTVRVAATGLPNIPALIKMFGSQGPQPRRGAR